MVSTEPGGSVSTETTRQTQALPPRCVAGRRSLSGARPIRTRTQPIGSAIQSSPSEPTSRKTMTRPIATVCNELTAGSLVRGGVHVGAGRPSTGRRVPGAPAPPPGRR